MRTPARRIALALVLACPLVALAQRAATDGFYEVRHLYPAPRAGTVPVERLGVATQHAELGRRLATRALALYARDNGNTRFALWVRTERRPRCEQGVLRLGGTARVVESWGGDAEACTLDFELDATGAARVAAALGVQREERHPVGESLAGTFAPARASFARGQPVELVLTITNPAGAPVVDFRRGGRQRGPRDNQFSFRVTRDGHEVPAVDAPDFGGISQRLPIEPGGSVEVRAPLAAWGDVSRPGRYAVECAYETELSPHGVDPFSDGHRGEIWDRRFEGTVTFRVR